MLVRAVEIRDNVVFHETNEISTTRGKWLATIVSDFTNLVILCL